MRHLIPLLVMVSLLLSGCWDNVDISDRAVVMGMGLDVSADDEIQLALLITTPISPENGQAEDQFVITSTGSTPESAKRSIQMRLPRELFFGQLQSIILSRELAENPQLMQRVIDDLLRNAFLNRKAFLTVAREGKPVDILTSVPPLEESPAMFIAEAHDRVRRNLMHPRTELWEFLRAVTSPGRDPIAVGVAAGEDQLDLSGIALFRDYQLVGWLGTMETRGMMWLRGEGNGSTVSFTTDQGTAEVSITKSRVLSSSPPADSLFVCRIRVIGELLVAPAEAGLLDEADFQVLESGLSAAIQAEAEQALRMMQQANADGIGVGHLIYYAHPHHWARLNWREDFPELTFRTEVLATITRRGALN